jgi:hypothetical protein
LADGRLFIWNGNGSKIFNPAAEAFSEVADPPVAESVRRWTRNLRLADGRIAFFGGRDGSGSDLSSILIYQPLSDSFSVSARSLLHGKVGVVPTLHPSGRVLLMSGSSGAELDASTAVDIWDPVADTLVGSPILSLVGLLPFTNDAGNLGFSGAAEMRGSAGVLGWYGAGVAGGSSQYVVYDPAQGSFLPFMIPWAMGRTYTVEVLAGVATPTSAGSPNAGLTLPIQEQAEVRVRVTASDGSVGTLTFSVAYGD